VNFFNLEFFLGYSDDFFPFKHPNNYFQSNFLGVSKRLSAKKCQKLHSQRKPQQVQWLQIRVRRLAPENKKALTVNSRTPPQVSPQIRIQNPMGFGNIPAAKPTVRSRSQRLRTYIFFKGNPTQGSPSIWKCKPLWSLRLP
jgi:hypothetical protein